MGSNPIVETETNTVSKVYIILGTLGPIPIGDTTR